MNYLKYMKIFSPIFIIHNIVFDYFIDICKGKPYIFHCQKNFAEFDVP